MNSVFIMCAGKSERFGACKPILPVQGRPNYLRTIDILGEMGIKDVTITVPKNKTKFFEYDRKIEGENAREIDRFRNLRDVISGNSLLLYGDVIYDEVDLLKIVETCKEAKQITFFGTKKGNQITKKAWQEIKAVFIYHPTEFYKAVDLVASKFEKGIIAREIGWEVYKELGNPYFVTLSDYTDDFDTPAEYQNLLKIYK